MPESPSARPRRQVTADPMLARVFGGALLLGAVGWGYLSWMVFHVLYSGPCSFSENECLPNSGTRFEAIGSMAFALVVLVSIVQAAIRVFGARREDITPEKLAGPLLTAVVFAALWVAWLVLVPTDATSCGEADCALHRSSY